MAIIYKAPTAQQIANTVYPDNVDFSTFVNGKTADLDPNWRPVKGPRIVAEKVVRKWIALSGEYHDTTIGVGLVTYVNSTLSPVEISALQAEMKAQAATTEGLDDIDVELDKDESTGVLTVKGNMVLTNGTTWIMIFTLSSDTLSKITLLGPNAF